MVLAAHHCLGISVVGEEQLRLKLADTYEESSETASRGTNICELTWPAADRGGNSNKLYCSSRCDFL